MDEITQQNTALVEAAAAASESMQQQAQKLAELVNAFRLVQGQATQPAHREERVVSLQSAKGHTTLSARAAAPALFR